MSKFKEISNRVTCDNPVIDGVPSGGFVDGLGIRIDWQNGALGRGEDRKDPNGAFVDTVIYAVLQKLERYQDSKFNCNENAWAIQNLKSALSYLNSRTERREDAKIEGTHEVD